MFSHAWQFKKIRIILYSTTNQVSHSPTTAHLYVYISDDRVHTISEPAYRGLPCPCIRVSVNVIIDLRLHIALLYTV